jgi:hypothetical protein
MDLTFHETANDMMNKPEPVQPVRFEDANGQLVGGCLFIRGGKEFEAVLHSLPTKAQK